MSQITERIGFPELLVKASNFAAAKEIVRKELGAQYRYDASDVSIQGYSIVRLFIDTNDMTDEFYETIRQSERVSLLSDGMPGIKNREKALRSIGGIENKLRKMLIYVSDKIDGFEGLFNIDTAAKNRLVQGIVAKGDIDPLVSYLTFGGMIKLLGLDLTLSSKNTTTRELAEMIAVAESLPSLQSKLKDRLNSRKVWDIIASTLLEQPVKWSSIEKDLQDLKDYRNTAAHFRCITSSDNDKIAQITKRLHDKMKFTNPRHLSDEEKTALKELFDRIHEELGLNSLWDFPIPLQKAYHSTTEVNSGGLLQAMEQRLSKSSVQKHKVQGRKM